MFGTIRKHQSWLWIFIIAVMIIGLVIAFSPSSQFRNSGGGGGNFGSIDGVRVTQNEYVNAHDEVFLSYFLRNGRWPDSDAAAANFNADREIYQWLFFQRKIKQYNIHVDDQSVARLANNILTQFGRGTPVPIDTFVQQVLKPRADLSHFQRYVRHQLELQQLFAVLGLSGDLVPPRDAQTLYVRDNQEIATEAVFFSGSNYLAGIPAPSAQMVAQFYTNQMAVYRLPERVQVSYVAFSLTNYMAEAKQALTNLADQVDYTMKQLGTNYVRYGKTTDEAKSKIHDLMLQREAMSFASRDADAFATTLFDMPPKLDSLISLAKSNNLPVKVTAPFDEENGPSGFDGGPNFAQEAFARTPDEPFGGPVSSDDTVYVFALNKRIPSEIPPLENIRARVTADCTHYEAVAKARNVGVQLARSITNGLAQGKTFAAICADAKVKPTTIPPFSISTQELPEVENHLDLRSFKQVAFTTPVGKSSDFSPTRDGGFIVFVQKRLPIDTAKMNAEMPDFLKRVQEIRREDAINFWFNREFGQSLRGTPLNQPKPSSLTTAGPS